MTIYEIAVMMATSCYPYEIVIDDRHGGNLVGKVANIDRPDITIAEVEINPVGDFTIRVEGKKDVTFVTPLDVIMWIVQTL